MSFNGGIIPLNNSHSVIDNPDPVNLIKLVSFLINNQKLTILGVKKILNKKINSLDQYHSMSIKAEYYKNVLSTKSKNLLKKIKKLKK